MARPIKETPTLRGQEARDFEQKIIHPKSVSPNDVRDARDSYNRVMSIAKLTFWYFAFLIWIHPINRRTRCQGLKSLVSPHLPLLTHLARLYPCLIPCAPSGQSFPCYLFIGARCAALTYPYVVHVKYKLFSSTHSMISFTSHSLMRPLSNNVYWIQELKEVRWRYVAFRHEDIGQMIYPFDSVSECIVFYLPLPSPISLK